jgi:hypothetical protein
MVQSTCQNPRLGGSDGCAETASGNFPIWWRPPGVAHGAGALLYVVNAGINKDVSTISSVSGGSITNAFIAQECDFRETSQNDFEPLASKLASAIINRGVLDSTMVSRYYLAVLACVAALTLWSFSRFGTNFLPWQTSLFSMIGLIALVSLRGALIEHLFGAVLFRKGARATTLGSVKGTTKHVLCATELVYAIPYYFVTSPTGHAKGYMTRPHMRMNEEVHSVSKVKLQAAVRASGGIPGAFPPRRLRLGPGSKHFLLLADGGLWNNLGTQWWDLDNREFSFVILHCFCFSYSLISGSSRVSNSTTLNCEKNIQRGSRESRF